MINYYYDKDQGIYELFFNDVLLVELPYCDPMTDTEADNLAQELFTQYMDTKHG